MVLITLRQAFVRHYRGSVFCLDIVPDSDSTIELSWTREKLPPLERYFQLPDNGRGESCLLPASITLNLRQDLLNSIDIKSGPCRITSVSDTLKSNLNDPQYAEPTPLGMGKLLLMNTRHYLKNKIIIQDNGLQSYDRVVLVDRQANIEYEMYSNEKDFLSLDCSALEAGFYSVNILEGNTPKAYFTFIKCIPFYCSFVSGSSHFIKEKTIW